MAEFATLDSATVHDNIARKQAAAETVVRKTPTYRISSQHAEITALIRHLIENNGSRRAEILRTLRKLVKKSGGQLPDVDRMEFFEAFYHMVGDQRWKVACECTMLIVDIIPQMGDHDLDPCVSVVLPRVIPNLGHESIDVRRATLRLLHVYMRYTNNLQKVLRMYVQYGLQSSDKNAQKGCILSLPLLFTEEFGNENLFPLVESLGNLLVNSEASLFYPVFLALQRLHSLVGNETFKLYLKHINPEAVMLYQRVLSRNSTANSGRNENEAVDFGDLQNNNTVSIDKLITCGDTPKPFEDYAKKDSDSSTDNRFAEPERAFKPRMLFDADYTLRYGVFPPAALNRVLSSKLNEKNDGIQQILSVLREAPSNHISALIPYLDAFMEDVVNKLVDHPNFKITLHGLEMVEAVIERLKLSTQSFIKPIVKVLFKRLGDSRAVVREHNIKVIHRMMYHFPPQHVIECILEQKYHRNPKIREEVVNRVTAALLMFPRTEFDLCKLCYEIAPMLVDSKRMVRLASLECIAVLAQALGHHRLTPLMSAVEATEAGSESEGLINAVQVSF
ncbi:protein FAM179B-like protein [Dinothrombium tinctorium]|uniref:Protein FAM179B-like protein n=1 Tax=Dinothrombium tinctorium TaxID=1965070 RepID=A0A443QRH8_9ACAR|nr:protein FAM179B-like protein [Dinothrombium tinctorium]